MKHNQRLDYSRLAEVLNERGMADTEAIRDLLNTSMSGGTPFTEALVTSNFVGDWDLSRIVCEIFNLPFLPVDMASPDPEAAQGLNTATFVQNGLVPLGQFGQVLTVCMPALVPADVLGMLAAETDMDILPVVGTVETNRRWLAENFGADESVAGARAASNTGWSTMFDDANAAVMMDIEPGDEDGSMESGVEALEQVVEESSVAEFSLDDDADLESTDLELLEIGEDTDLDGPSPTAETPASSAKSASSGEDLDLPSLDF